ncbi:hypothetical protein A7985_24230 [Pseudoalteromonas luteoviolacea]|uniref:Uncharacterized protein n=1 Tax=Pseudoalteromonas luteoviolacea TaxID=43657 RepID=A0A1C0TJ82_9GAMM|nr:hypothetical protein [Pseudoalteromonas luteoviolacea]OCQ18320.1 hypothetical protein A7985_24230 [Pseudoalteromonas luteoviolacea]
MKANRTLSAIIGLGLFATCSSLQAASLITHVKLDKDLVVVEVQPKKQTGSLSCVEQGKQHLWAVDTSSTAGKKLYATLLGALTEQSSVELISGQDCEHTQGYERLIGIRIK